VSDSLVAGARVEEREPSRPWQHPAFRWTLAGAGLLAAGALLLVAGLGFAWSGLAWF
jgi:hypothetical protein